MSFFEVRRTLLAPPERIWAILTDARTKVVFGGLSPEDAETMADLLYMGELDFEEAKTSLNKPVTVGHDLRWFESESTMTSRSESESTGRTVTRGTSTSTTRTRGTSQSDGWSDTPASGGIGGIDIPPALNRNGSTGTSTGTSVATGTSTSEAESRSRSVSIGRGETSGRSEGLVPILEVLPTTVFSLEEQRHRKAALLRNLRRQEAVVKMPERESVAFRAARVVPGVANPERVERFKRDTFLRSPFVKPIQAVDALLRARRRSLERRAAEAADGAEEPQDPEDFLE